MGFYHIAVEAQVPVLPVALDYAHRVLRLGPLHHMTGQQEVDVPRLQAFFEGVRGRHGSGPNGTPAATQPGSAEAGSTGTGKR
jgi:1-acyl-sn-glycerol-3-phosphate acyltransferase